jgi:hypothetical protein
LAFFEREHGISESADEQELFMGVSVDEAAIDSEVNIRPLHKS